MGHIRLITRVRTAPGSRGIPLTLYWDTGAASTFVRRDRAEALGHLFRLPIPAPFGGLGNGRFRCIDGIHLQVFLKGIWCPHFAYVAGRQDLDDEVLVGHDLMQKYDIQMDPRHRRLLIDPDRLRAALRIR